MARKPRKAARPGWVRTHFDNALVAQVQWLGNQYEITVTRAAEATPVRHDCCRAVGALARRQADRVVAEMYPHTCDKSDCGPWIAVGTPPRA
jgi:hypothetical protein